jgi:small-conductance mechanosensitive channel
VRIWLRKGKGMGARWGVLLVAAAVLCGGTLSDAASPSKAPALRSAAQIISDLTAMIDWCDHVSAFTNVPVSVDEALYRDGVRSGAGESVRLAFDVARAEANLLAASETATPTTGPGARTQTLIATAQAVARRIADINAELADIDQQLSHGPTTQPEDLLTAKRTKLLAELNLTTERHSVLENLASYMNGSGGGATELLQKIDDLQRTVPDLPTEPAQSTPTDQSDSPADNSGQSSSTSTPAAPSASASGGSPPATPAGNPLSSVVSPVGTTDNSDSSSESNSAPAGPPPFRPDTAGIFGLVGELFTLTGRMSTLTNLNTQAKELQDGVDAQRGPIRIQLLAALKRADTLGAKADANSVGKLQTETGQLQELNERFRQLTAAAVPLSEESIELQRTTDRIAAWHKALEDTYAESLRYLLIHLGGMMGGILFVLLMSKLWKRATFRYVTDPRRRRVFLLVRRIVSGSLITLIMVMTFVTEFASLATFAGLITAGVAVALQSIILAGVAYFFVVGRYGIRIGDRVTVNGITGDVVDTGLFRFYLMELAGTGFDLHPTGRIVVFSNAVLFQSTALYKQIPGADYVWHEVSMTLSPDSDYKLAQDMLMAAVESVYDTYKDRIAQQHHLAASQIHLPIQEPRPQGRLRFVDAGLEFAVRYPVEIARSAEVDDQVTRALLERIEQEPKLKLVISGTPRIQRAA